MIETCEMCNAKFFDNTDSQRYAKRHIGYCRGIMTKEPEEFKRIIGHSRESNKWQATKTRSATSGHT